VVWCVALKCTKIELRTEVIIKIFLKAVEKKVELYNEDCLDTMKRIETASIDMILCDLPYGTTACKWDVIIPFNELWNEYERVIKDNGAIVLFASQPFTSALIMSNPKLFRYELIWEKPNPSNPLLANKQPLKNHENICVFYKKQPNFNPNKIIRLQKDKRKQKKKEIGVFETTGQKRIIPSTDKEYKLGMSVLFFNREQTGFHPTQKPLDLLRTLIRMFTSKNEVILDNTMGSGSTGVACIIENRNFIGIEKKKNYFDIATNRIKEEQTQTKLF